MSQTIPALVARKEQGAAKARERALRLEAEAAELRRRLAELQEEQAAS